MSEKLVILKGLESLFELSDKFANSYFWSPPQTPRLRRDFEIKNSIPVFYFKFKENTYSVEFTVSCSSRKIYVFRQYTKNGKKVNIRTIKSVYNEMKESDL